METQAKINLLNNVLSMIGNEKATFMSPEYGVGFNAATGEVFACDVIMERIRDMKRTIKGTTRSTFSEGV